MLCLNLELIKEIMLYLEQKLQLEDLGCYAHTNNAYKAFKETWIRGVSSEEIVNHFVQAQNAEYEPKEIWYALEIMKEGGYIRCDYSDKYVYHVKDITEGGHHYLRKIHKKMINP